MSDFDFDETWYVQHYPDVATAIEAGNIKSGLEHYMAHGREEGRKASSADQFDPNWYSKAYPIVREELPFADVTELENHYRQIGRYRGYLPTRDAKRAENPAALASAFGGLWIDAANAHDLIDGKHEIGVINSVEAKQLKSFINDGYIVFESAVSPSILDRAEEELEAAYTGQYPQLRFECHGLDPNHINWRPGLKDHAAKALDFHVFSNPIRNLMFCDTVTRFLNLIFERAPLASQSLTFYLGSGQELHQDSAYVAYTLPLQFAASWIALEDVKLGGGELEYLVGSHRALPEFLYPGGFKSVSEALRAPNCERDAVSIAVRQHVKAIVEEGERLRLQKSRFLAKRGDILIWHADLAHGGSKVSSVLSRKSLVTHYCPKEVSPLFTSNERCVIKKHGAASYYTTGVYLPE